MHQTRGGSTRNTLGLCPDNSDAEDTVWPGWFNNDDFPPETTYAELLQHLRESDEANTRVQHAKATRTRPATERLRPQFDQPITLEGIQREALAAAAIQ